MFSSENKCRLLFQSLIDSPGDITKTDVTLKTVISLKWCKIDIYLKWMI